MTTRAALLSFVFLALLAPSLASSQNHPADAAYQEGVRLYDLREWDPAIQKFKEAYQLRPEPKSLFNIAQSYRLKGDCGEAVSFYRTYRRNYPDAPNTEAVDKFIADLEPCPAVAVKPEPTTEPPPTTPTGPAPMPMPVSESPGNSNQTIAIVLGSAGVAAIVTGFAFGLHAQSIAGDVETGEGAWDPDLESRGERSDLIAKILWVGGGAAIVTGGVLFVLGRQHSAPVAVVPSETGAAVVWSGRF